MRFEREVRELRELRKANGIFRPASAPFAQAERSTASRPFIVDQASNWATGAIRKTVCSMAGKLSTAVDSGVPVDVCSAIDRLCALAARSAGRS